MKRSERASIAQETVDIVKAGRYTSFSGNQIDISEAVQSCLNRTQYLTPRELERIRLDVISQPSLGLHTQIEVMNETTLSAISRLAKNGPVAALNFASAKNPGGGFLGGSEAQEESLARSSALYASELTQPEFYEKHRQSRSALYSHAMIVSPDCPIIRNDEAELLDHPQLATFITSAAPNAGATKTNAPLELDQIPEILRVRSEYVLGIAASLGYRQLILGAWGCGVFRNDPELVAQVFNDHLRGAWQGRFERVTFSVLDYSASLSTFRAFETVL